ncbi:MAG: hypothetical protein JEZ06_17265 [Anaerolineaceae bacterium]|nr:hypothetical protein [Anaerolineaceae bacterium]
MSEKEALKSGKNILIGSMQMKDIARAREKDETSGFDKILSMQILKNL